ncbi:RNA polymerase II-associated protein 1-like [Glandiceps talaboti]
MSLPDLQCHPVDDKQHPCIQHHSPYGFMSAFLRLVFIWAKMHKGIAAKFSAIIESSYVISYLEKTLQSPRSVGETLDRHFSRFEHIVLYYIVKIYQQVAQQTESCHQYSKLYHSIALLLFTSLHPGDEHIAHDLMSTVLFNTEYLVEGRIGDPEAVELAELLKVTDKDVTPKPQHQSLHGKEPNRGVLLRDAYSNLPSIRACYMTSFNDMMVAVARSRSKFLMIPCEIESHLLTEFTGALVPMDWTFLPLLQLYNQASKAELMGASMENLPGNYVMGITNTLRMIFMLETWRPDSINHISMAAKITRLMCVFLTGNDVFLEDTVHYYLSVLLRIYTQSDYLDKLDFNVPIPGVASFYDLYVVLLTQYGAVSFGDPIFASFLLLPLQQKYSVELKKAVWVEHQEVIRSLGMPIQECIVPVERFLTPQESNLEAIQMYMFALMSGLVRQSWSPILYLIAVHHVNGFLFDTKMNKTQQLMKAQYQMLKQVLDMKNQEVQQHLLLYRTINKDSFAGFDMFTELPAERQQLLQSIQQNQ